MDDVQAPGPFLLPQALADLDAGHAGHAHVEQHMIHLRRPGQAFQGRLAGVRFQHLDPQLAEDGAGQHAIDLVVVYHQHFHHSSFSPMGSVK